MKDSDTVRVGAGGLFLRSDDAKSGRRFAALFRLAWARIPAFDQREMQAHWGETARPLIVLADRLDPDSKPAPAEPAGQTLARCWFDGLCCRDVAFWRPAVDLMPDPAVLGVIAHEMAHVRDGIDGGALQWELATHRLARAWGFGPETNAANKWSTAYYALRAAIIADAHRPTSPGAARPPVAPAELP